MLDFRALYFPSRCLIDHCDPYNESQVMHLYAQQSPYALLDTDKERQMSSRFVYLPTTFSAIVPFALLPWESAQILWSILTGVGLILASFLIWSFGANRAPVISACLIAFLLANCELFLMQGMCAGIAISLCSAAVWCFFRNRFIVAGICFLAISLAVKPQDTGIVWLYFLLAGGIFRKRALQTLFVWSAVSLPAFIWTWIVAPNWIKELRSNILAFSAHGGINDPSLASSGAHGLSRIVSLQSVLSILWDDPKFYNLASLFLVAPLFLVWAYWTMRKPFSPERAWIAIAAASPLAMLPIYHRQYDAILILLTMPACALLVAEGGMLGRIALIVNAVGFFLTGELPWVALLLVIRRISIPTGTAAGQVLKTVLTGVEVLTMPIAIFTMASFYLWIYVKRSDVLDRRRDDGGTQDILQPIG